MDPLRRPFKSDRITAGADRNGIYVQGMRWLRILLRGVLPIAAARILAQSPKALSGESVTCHLQHHVDHEARRRDYLVPHASAGRRGRLRLGDLDQIGRDLLTELLDLVLGGPA